MGDLDNSTLPSAPHREVSSQVRPAQGGGPWSRDLIKDVAMDIGKEVAAYIEVMYPNAVKATSSTFLLSVRNSIYNEIMAALDLGTEEQIAARLKERKDFRREWKASWKKIRATKPPATDENDVAAK